MTTCPRRGYALFCRQKQGKTGDPAQGELLMASIETENCVKRTVA
jgi:hypothetical protein